MCLRGSRASGYGGCVTSVAGTQFTEVVLRGALRLYQRLALEAFEADWAAGRTSTHLAPPGSGRPLSVWRLCGGLGARLWCSRRRRRSWRNGPRSSDCSLTRRTRTSAAADRCTCSHTRLSAGPRTPQVLRARRQASACSRCRHTTAPRLPATAHTWVELRRAHSPLNLPAGAAPLRFIERLAILAPAYPQRSGGLLGIHASRRLSDHLRRSPPAGTSGAA